MKYIVMSQVQKVGWSHNVKTNSKSFERVEELKYLGTIQTYQNSIQEEIKSSWSQECLLSSSAEYFVFQFAIQKCKD